MSTDVISYLAGYFDGEGCISISKSWPCALNVTVTSGDRECIQLFCDTFGGNLRQPPSSSQSGNGINRHRTIYRWCLTAYNAQEALRKMLPYLRAKKKQAEIACIPRYSGRKYGVRGLPDEEILKRLMAANVVSALKREWHGQNFDSI